MEKKFTPNDILRDLYKESTVSEQLAIQEQRHVDNQFAEDYTKLKEAKDSLDAIQMNAPSFIIQNILDYSRDSKLETELH